MFHVTQFIERWHTLCLMGEHGLESVHHIMNDEFRSLNSVRDTQVRCKLILHQNLKCTGNTKSLTVVKRKCACRGRFKLNESLQRKCQICDSLPHRPI